jgi:hypothetical protein
MHIHDLVSILIGRKSVASGQAAEEAMQWAFHIQSLFLVLSLQIIPLHFPHNVVGLVILEP